MAKLVPHYPFEVAEVMKAIGNNIKIARTRRRMMQDELAFKCGITRKTLWRLERGEGGISFATVCTVLSTLGLLESVKSVAAPDEDEHGKILEAARMPQRVRETRSIDNDF